MEPPQFADRADAGRRLAACLQAYSGRDCVILALPRGGVPIAHEISKALSLPMDLMLVRKIGAPGDPEVAIGAVADAPTPRVLMNEGLPPRFHASNSYVTQQIELLTKEIARRRRLYTESRPPIPLKGRAVLLVDDGIATGPTILVAVQALALAEPAKTVVAVPVAPAETIEKLRAQVSDVVCLLTPERFRAVGLHYADFHQVSDDEVIDIMRNAASGGFS